MVDVLAGAVSEGVVRAGEGLRDQSAAIYRVLKETIISGRLSPGARLVEKRLAARFATSRTPVRAALDRLEQEGFVVTTPGFKHAFSQVAPLSAADGVDVLGVLAVLNGAAARIAAERPRLVRRELVVELTALNDRLAALADAPWGAEIEAEELDVALHRLIVNAAGRPRLAALAESARAQVTRYGRIHPEVRLDVSESVAIHAALIDAIGRGDPSAAERAAALDHRRAGIKLREGLSAGTPA